MSNVTISPLLIPSDPVLCCRLLFKLPRVVLQQKEKFEEEDIFKKHARDGEVRYTLYRDRPVHERQAKFQAGCRDGHTEIVSSLLNTVFSPASPSPTGLPE